MPNRNSIRVSNTTAQPCPGGRHVRDARTTETVIRKSREAPAAPGAAPQQAWADAGCPPETVSAPASATAWVPAPQPAARPIPDGRLSRTGTLALPRSCRHGPRQGHGGHDAGPAAGLGAGLDAGLAVGLDVGLDDGLAARIAPEAPPASRHPPSRIPAPAALAATRPHPAYNPPAPRRAPPATATTTAARHRRLWQSGGIDRKNRVACVLSVAPEIASAKAAFYSGCLGAPPVAFCLRLPSFEHKLIEPVFFNGHIACPGRTRRRKVVFYLLSPRGALR